MEGLAWLARRIRECIWFWEDAKGVHVLVPPGVFISNACGRRVRRHSPTQRGVPWSVGRGVC